MEAKSESQVMLAIEEILKNKNYQESSKVSTDNSYVKLWQEYAMSVQDFDKVYTFLMENSNTIPLNYKSPIRFAN